MKIVYFGTPYFAARVLSYLISESFSISAVITRPDRPKGRSLKVSPSPVKKMVQESFPEMLLLQPEKASNPEFLEKLRSLQADLFVVVGYGQILSEELLRIPKLCINVHASLLPKYRGADPMRRALLAGEKESGITIMKMVKELDAGDMYEKEKITIDSDINFTELQEKLIQVSGPLLKKVLKQYQSQTLSPEKQDERLSNYAKKIASQEREISWNFPAEQIHNQIRAFSKTPGAWCFIQVKGEKKKCKILRSKVAQQNGAPSEVLEQTKKKLVVACKEKALEILELQLEGKKPLTIQSFLAGFQEKILF